MIAYLDLLWLICVLNAKDIDKVLHEDWRPLEDAYLPAPCTVSSGSNCGVSLLWRRFSTCDRSSLRDDRTERWTHLKDSLNDYSPGEDGLVHTQCHCSTHHLGATGAAPHRLRRKVTKQFKCHQPMNNHIHSPSRNFILDAMLLIPYRLRNTWQNSFNGAELLLATILLSTACTKTSAFLNGVSPRTSTAWLLSCLVTSSLLYRPQPLPRDSYSALDTTPRNIVGTRVEPSYERAWLAKRKDTPFSSKLAFNSLRREEVELTYNITHQGLRPTCWWASSESQLPLDQNRIAV